MRKIDGIVNLLIRYLIKNGYMSSKELQDKHYRVSELYYQSAILFNILCQTYPDWAWKSTQHYDGTMFPGDFIVGIKTPFGHMSNHYKMEYYDAFDVRELDKAPEYDGYTEDEAIIRLNSLPLIGDSYIETNEYISLITELNYKTTALGNIINQLIYELWKLNELKPSNMNVGYYHIKDLYSRRREYYKLTCHNRKDLAWKSKCDIAGECISDDTFMAGLHTDFGPVCLVFNDEYYDEFDIPELPRAPLLKGEVYIGVPEKLSSIKIRQMKTK